MHRSWGEFSWCLERLTSQEWDILGCLSTEQRCTKAIEILGANRIHRGYYPEIKDVEDTIAHRNLRDDYRRALIEILPSAEIDEYQLLEPLYRIRAVVDHLVVNTCGNVVLDITSLPKRFFFPMIKFILGTQIVQNLVVTYTCPMAYAENNLSESPTSWAPIFPFSGDPTEDSTEVIVICLGFMPLGLPDLLKGGQFNDTEIRLLFPFPPGPPNYQRTWNFVSNIFDGRVLDVDNIKRVHGHNTPIVYKHLENFTDNGSKRSLFAPYGPKPMSLAMALFANKFNIPVYYTQPTIYNPAYSKGASHCYSYCIRLNGTDLY